MKNQKSGESDRSGEFGHHFSLHRLGDGHAIVTRLEPFAKQTARCGGGFHHIRLTGDIGNDLRRDLTPAPWTMRGMPT